MKRMICFLLFLTMIASLLVGCGNQEPTNTVENTTPNTTAPTEGDVVTEQPNLLYADARVVVDGIVHEMNIYVMDGLWYLSADNMTTLFGTDFAESFVNLDSYAQELDIRYTQDEMLSAVYFNTWESYSTSTDLSLFETYIAAMELPMDMIDQETITGTEVMEMLDLFVAYAAPEKLEQWKALFPKVRAYSEAISRIDVMGAIFVAAYHVGDSYTDVSYSYDTVDRDLMNRMEEESRGFSLNLFGDSPYDLGDFGHDHCGIGAIVYNLVNICPLDGSYPMAYDHSESTFHMDEKSTYGEAMTALLRVVATYSNGYISIDDLAVVTLSSAITQEHLDKANASPVVTAENAPALQGFVGGMEYSSGSLTANSEDMILTANWGFNAYCVKFDYTAFFDDNVENVNLNNLAYLDGLVATAIENNLHLCLIATALPGRWTGSNSDFTSYGDFDLFINPEKQELANRLWEILAKRYEDIPSANLSFCPFWEANNGNLSSGLPSPDYSNQDIADYLSLVVDAIRAEDPDRMIIYEPCCTTVNEDPEIRTPSIEVAREKGNMLMLANFGDGAFIYAAMTAEEGANIDNNNHSIRLPEYPTYYYELNDYIGHDSPLVLEGFLPEGTVINVYLSQSTANSVEFYSDGVLIYSEWVEQAEYEVGYPLSSHMPFATSNKVLSVTLTQTANTLSIAPEYDVELGNHFVWSGIEVILPEEYAQEKWYSITAYDVFLGIEEQEGLALRKTSTIQIYPSGGSDVFCAVIHEDLTFTTEKIKEQASTETINTYADELKAQEEHLVVRFEDATFVATIWSEVKEYYTDILHAFSDRDISWFSNDWENITNRSKTDLAGSTTVEYMGYSDFNLELLQLLQSFQK